MQPRLKVGSIETSFDEEMLSKRSLVPKAYQDFSKKLEKIKNSKIMYVPSVTLDGPSSVLSPAFRNSNYMSTTSRRFLERTINSSNRKTLDF